MTNVVAPLNDKHLTSKYVKFQHFWEVSYVLLRYAKNTITNLDSIIEYYFYATFSTFSLLIKALALLFNRLYLSKASQASLLGLNDFCIYFPVLINL